MTWECALCTLINVNSGYCAACAGSFVVCLRCQHMNNFRSGSACSQCLAPLEHEPVVKPCGVELLDLLRSRAVSTISPGVPLPTYVINTELLRELDTKGGFLWLLQTPRFRSAHFHTFLVTLVEGILGQVRLGVGSLACLRLVSQIVSWLLTLDDCVCLWPLFFGPASLEERHELWRLLACLGHRFKDSDLAKIRYLLSLTANDKDKFPQLEAYFSPLVCHFARTARDPWWECAPACSPASYNSSSSSSLSSSSSFSSSLSSSSSSSSSTSFHTFSCLPEEGELDDEGWSDEASHGDRPRDNMEENWDSDEEDIPYMEFESAKRDDHPIESLGDDIPLESASSVPQVNIHVVASDGCETFNVGSQNSDKNSESSTIHEKIPDDSSTSSSTMHANNGEKLNTIPPISLPRSPGNPSWKTVVTAMSAPLAIKISVPPQESKEFLDVIAALAPSDGELADELLAECLGTGRIELLRQALIKIWSEFVPCLWPTHKLGLLSFYCARMDTRSDLHLQAVCSKYLKHLVEESDFPGVVELCKAVPSVDLDICSLITNFWEAPETNMFTLAKNALEVCQTVRACNVSSNVFLQSWLIDMPPTRNISRCFASVFNAFCSEFGPEPGVHLILHHSTFWTANQDRQGANRYLNKIRSHFVNYFDELDARLNLKYGKDVASIVIAYYGLLDSWPMKAALMELPVPTPERHMFELAHAVY